MRRRYDAVLMNPPFGEPVADTKVYLRATYPWMPKITDLLAAFVGRGLELCTEGGSVGAITSRAGLFLTSFENWRRSVLLENSVVAVADFGFGVMEQALVEAAAYVVKKSSGSSEESTFVRLLKESDRPRALERAAAASRNGEVDSRVFRLRTDALEPIPGSPFAYWLCDSVRDLFVKFPPVEGPSVEVRQGLATADDFRFVRAAWEVNPDRITTDRAATAEGFRWVPFAKGGDYSPYWSDLHLVVDWENDGHRIKESVDAKYPYLNGKIEWVVKNTAYYFLAGLTWPRRTNSGFGVRVLPAGAVFADKGPGAFCVSADPRVLLAWLSSRLVQALMDSMVAAGEEVSSGGASRSYEVGLVQKLPWPGKSLVSDGLLKSIEEIVLLRRELDLTDETSSSFMCPVLPVSGQTLLDAVAARIEREERRTLHILEETLVLDELVTSAVDLGDEGRRYLDEEIGPHPCRYRSEIPDADRFATLYGGRIDVGIDELIGERGGSRSIANLTYFADRRLEVLAHGLEVHPEALVAERRRRGIFPWGEPARTAADLFSYFVGLAFGRWDINVGIDPAGTRQLADPFEPRPLCSPGMLVGERELAARMSPSTYALPLPSDRLLLDEPGHEWDLEVALARVSDAVMGSSDWVLLELVQALGSNSIRAHLRTKFFKEHLSRYSRSRRKAPIYWPLTVPSGRWGVWAYAPSLSRELLYAVASEALRREGNGESEIARLERERSNGRSSRGSKALDQALDDERKLAEELRRFREEAERIAGLGWEPDLDDGIVLCAAPLADLFPMWKEPARYRKELRAGKYEWSAVSKWSDQL
jgi:hypothetical protein